MATAQGRAASTPKHGRDGKFVGAAAAKAAKPSLAELVDGRMVALEQGISAAAEEDRGRFQSLAADFGELKQSVADVRGAVEMLPMQAAESAVRVMETAEMRGVKNLHRRVRLIVSDAAGVRMTDQTFDLSVQEVLRVDVAGTSFSALQLSSEGR